MWTLEDASPERLGELAKELEASGRWMSFLTPQEHQFLQAALNLNEQTWALFLEGKIPCQMRISSAEDASPASIDVDPVALAFRVRYMLWDAQLDRLSDGPQKNASSSSRGPASSSQTQTAPEPRLNSGSRFTEEDYDDDEDEDGADSQADGQSGSAVPKVLIVESKEEDSEPDPRGRIATIKNCSKMYHTFDTDNDAWQRYQRLQASDEQIDEQEKRSENGAERTASSETNSISALAKTAQFGSASLSLKHLLGTIESKWDELRVTDVELRNLISDVRKNRSKWASEERIGQEELYEACEKVVQELRGTTEHSTAFLNKVNKRDAPNYYQIIKHPMDLNTVMRKLRAYQYDSKTDFVDDLSLIWQNCLTYNSDPRHFLRAHAIAMRKKTAALSPLIPDIKIRARAEVEAEAEEQERSKLAGGTTRRDSGDGDGGKGQKRKLGKAPAATSSAVETPDHADVESVETYGGAADDDDNPTPGKQNGASEPPRAESSDAVLAGNGDANGDANGVEPAKESELEARPDEDTQNNNGDTSHDATKMEVDDEWTAEPDRTTEGATEGATVDGQLPSNASEPDLQEDEDSTSDKNGDDEALLTPIDEEYKMPDVETVVWNSASKRRKLECITSRRALFTDNKLQMDAPIELRRPGLMVRFDNAIKSEDAVGQNAGVSLLSVDPVEEPFLVEYEVNAGLPSQPKDDQSPWITAPLPHAQDLPPTRYISRGAMSDMINKNLNEMQMIRRLTSKILFIRDLRNGQITQVSESSTAGPSSSNTQEYPDVHDPEPDIGSRLPGATRFDQRAAFSALQRATAKLAMHAGFEAAQPAAADVLTEVAADYLTKLGETLVANLEAPNSTASFGSILRGSLNDMGVDRLDHLSRYISDDIVKQGKRLATFRSRLNTILVDILRPEVERYNDEQFKDNSDQFVLGQFSNELGDDYFGFKELGIDQELGVSNISIPFHLLRQRLAADQSAGIAQTGSDSDMIGLGVPEYPPLTAEDIAKLPRFLREGFAKALPKSIKSIIALEPNTLESGTAPVVASSSSSSAAAAAAAPPAAPSADASSAPPADSADAKAEAQNRDLEKAASQAAAARAKVSASGKLVARKKNLRKAFIRQKQVSPKIEETLDADPGADAEFQGSSAGDPPVPTDDALIEDSVPDFQGSGAADLGSLSFDDPTAESEFNLDPHTTTGSLILGEDDGADASGANTAEMDDLDMSLPGFDM